MSLKNLFYDLNPSLIIYGAITGSYLFHIFRYRDVFVKLTLSFAFLGVLYIVCSGNITNENVFGGISDVISWAYSSRNKFGILFALFTSFAAICAIVTSGSSSDMRLCTMQFGCAMGVIYSHDIISALIYTELLSFLSAYTLSIQDKKNASRIAFMYLSAHLIAGVCLLSGILLYLKEHGDFARSGIWFLSESSHLNHYSIIFLSGLLILIGIPPLCYITMIGYGASNIQSSITLISTSTKIALFFTMQFFSGYQNLIWVGLGFIIFAGLYGMLCTKIRDSIMGFAFTHIGVIVSCLSLSGKFLQTAVSVDLMCSVVLIIYLLVIDQYSASIGKYTTLIHVVIATLSICSIPGTISSIGNTMIIHATSYQNYYIDIAIKFGHIVECMIAGKILFNFIIKYYFDKHEIKGKIDMVKFLFPCIIGYFITFFSIILPKQLTSLGMMFVTKADLDIQAAIKSILVVLGTIVMEMIIHRSRYIKNTILLRPVRNLMYSTYTAINTYNSTIYQSISKNLIIIIGLCLSFWSHFISIFKRIELRSYFLILVFFLLGTILIIAL